MDELKLLLINSQTQSVLVILLLSLGMVILRAPSSWGRWSCVFISLVVGLLAPLQAGFIFLIVAELLSHLAAPAQETSAANQVEGTALFVARLSMTCLCLLAAVASQQILHEATAIPIYIWAYAQFLAYPLAPARADRDAGQSHLIYLFCFALCFRQQVHGVDATQWVTCFSATALASVFIGNIRTTAVLGCLALSGMSALHLAFLIPFVCLGFQPAWTGISVVPLAVLAWLNAIYAGAETLSIVGPIAVFFASRGTKMYRPKRPLWYSASVSSIGLIAGGLVWLVNRDLVEDLYLKIQTGELFNWIGLGIGVTFWNLADWKIPWLSRGIKERSFVRYLSQRATKPTVGEIPINREPKEWEDLVRPSSRDRFLSSEIQLSLLFGSLLAALSLFYWIAKQ